MNMGIIEPGEHSLKPYTIIKTKKEIQKIMQNFHENYEPCRTDVSIGNGSVLTSNRA